jgi:hypothetical protein
LLWSTNQRLSTVPRIFDAKSQSIFDMLSDWLALLILPLVFVN